uniref:Secreted protein n=1 Tax=Rodentolepis nana TaxID=102285 RepID=A0A0R3TD60_RODNA
LESADRFSSSVKRASELPNADWRRLTSATNSSERVSAAASLSKTASTDTETPLTFEEGGGCCSNSCVSVWSFDSRS